MSCECAASLNCAATDLKRSSPAAVDMYLLCNCSANAMTASAAGSTRRADLVVKDACASLGSRRCATTLACLTPNRKPMRSSITDAGAYRGRAMQCHVAQLCAADSRTRRCLTGGNRQPVLDILGGIERLLLGGRSDVGDGQRGGRRGGSVGDVALPCGATGPSAHVETAEHPDRDRP